MTVFVDFLREVAYLTCETAPYLLVGFLIAGLIKVCVPSQAIFGHLGGNDVGSVVRASLYGIPIPLCSCSVIPAAASLQKSGASKGATAAFLISTPETGVDSISVTYALLDPIMTVVRPVVAFITAVLTGSGVALLVRRGWDSAGTGELAAVEAGHHHGHDHDGDGDGEGQGDDACGAAAPHYESVTARVRAASRYGFGALLDDLTPWLLVGFAVSAMIALATPDDLFAKTVPAGWPSMLLMMVVATPLYICATASTPIAAVLIAKGLDPGAALVFLLVGPATNFTTLLVVSRLLGAKALAIYLASITGVALVAGWLVSEAYALFRLDLAAVVSESMSREPGWLATLAGIVFAVLILRSAVRLDLWRGWRRRLVVGSAVALYATTCFTVLYPGEKGWVLRFGGVEQTLEEPGLYVHWPFPIARGEVVAADELRSVTVGFATPADVSGPRRPAAAARQLDDEAEVMTGDGTLLRVTYSVHYRWRDAYRVRFALDDPAAVTLGFAAAAIRQVVATTPSAVLMTEERAAIARRTQLQLQGELDAINSGIQVQSINVRDVHAPPDVHFEYRDVASALEDQQRVVHEAHGQRAETVSEAEAAAYRTQLQADSARDAAVQRARGDARRFLLNLAAYAAHRETSRGRLRLETLERVLGRARSFLLLGKDVQLELVETGGEGSPLDRLLGGRPAEDPLRQRVESLIRSGKVRR